MFFSTLLFGIALHSAGAITPLSEKAGHLAMGQTKAAVIARLGKPTWAIVAGDSGDFDLPDASVTLVLLWKNTPCAPVAVDFGSDGTVIGWDEGRAVCGRDVGLLGMEPSNDRSCSRSDRADRCKQ